VKLSSKEVTVIPTMAVASAVSHMAIGPLVNRAFHVPGPTLAGLVIMVPLLVAGAITFRRGIILLTSTLNGVILSAFVPIGFLAIPIYAIVGATLELFCLRSFTILFRPLYSFLAGGIANGISVLLIAAIPLGIRNPVILFIAVGAGFLSGAFGGILASAISTRIRDVRWKS
jgi:hypothetical protein